MIDHRPVYHFQPESDWMNDPKLFFHNGEYHVFYQYSPAGAWRLRHWGHTVSRDLVHWARLPIALTPTPGGPDQRGCYTGCVVQDGEKTHIIYTGVSPQVQCLATSTDRISWKKFEGNPVVGQEQNPEGFGPCFRDPCVWKEGDTWLMIVGSELAGVGGSAVMYASKDLVTWDYLHPLFTGDTERTGFQFECPDFFPLGDAHVLLTSCHATYWHVGRYADRCFSADKIGLIDGGKVYAAKTLLDDKGRRILWGWIREDRPKDEQMKAGWSGALSLPRVLTLRDDGTLGMDVVPEIETLRGEGWHFDERNEIEIGTRSTPNRLLPGPSGSALEIRAQFEPCSAIRYGVAVYCSEDLSERTDILYDRDAHTLMGATPLRLEKGEGLDLRIFLDGSVIEIYANGRACHTARVYPRHDHVNLGLVAYGGRAKVKDLDVWPMKGIW